MRLTSAEPDTSSVFQTLRFSLASNDATLATSLLLCPAWPTSCGRVTAVPDLVAAARGVHADAPSPVVVVDRFGGAEAATFCALSSLLRQAEFESHVDVYEACRMSHLARPGAWRAQENYFFLYQVGLYSFFNIFAFVR